MHSLTSLSRGLLVCWAVLVLGMAASVAYYADGAHHGNLLEFLFTRPSTPQITPALDPTPPPAPALTPQLPAEQATPAPQAPEWQSVAQGRSMGKGSIHNPHISVLENGQVSVIFEYTGTLGEISLYSPENVTALSVDIHGSWKSSINLDQKLTKGILARLQIFLHDKFLRVSAVNAGHVNTALHADVRTNGRQLRIIFSEGSK